MRAWITANISRRILWVIPVVLAAVTITGLAWPKGTPPVPVTTVDQTFTYDGTTWDCPVVNQWGAYLPDGTPVPYYVVLHCDMNPL